MMADETSDGVADMHKSVSHESHQRLLQEIERHRVDHTIERRVSCANIERTAKGKRACPDMGRGAHIHWQSSFEEQHGIDEVDKSDDRIKYATLPNPRIVNRHRVNDAEKQNIHEGMLYKTSRGKITSNVIRGQHEHKQHRRFQLTEHSLEYSQLLQMVCDIEFY